MMGKTTAAGWRTPYFLVEEEKLLHNLETLREVKERSGCRILLEGFQEVDLSFRLQDPSCTESILHVVLLSAACGIS